MTYGFIIPSSHVFVEFTVQFRFWPEFRFHIRFPVQVLVEPELEPHFEIPVPVMRTGIAPLKFQFQVLIDLFQS